MIVVMGHNLDPTNGWGNHAWNYLSQLKLKNIDFVAFVESKNGLSAAQEQFGYDKVFLISINRVFDLGVKFGYIPMRDLRFLEFKNITAVQVLCFSKISLIASKLANMADVPLFLYGHGTYAVRPWIRRENIAAYNRLLDCSAVIFFASEYTANVVTSSSDVKNLEHKIKVVPPGLNQRFCDAGKKWLSKRDKSITPNPSHFIGIGALKSRKGFDRSARLIAKSKYNMLNYHICGHYDNSSKKLIDGFDNVLLHGVVKNIETVINRSPVYMHTPRSNGWEFEGFGIVYLEAAAFGLPTISSNSGGAVDAVSKLSGLCVSQFNDELAVQQIEEYLNWFFDNYEYASTEQTKFAMKNSWNNLINDYLELYNENT